MKTRGVYEKVPGSGVWWVRHVDAQGRLRREKAGTKSAAIALYRKRKTQSLEGKKLPEKLRRPPISFKDLSRDALAYSKAHKRTHKEDQRRMERICSWFGDMPAESITPKEIERHLSKNVEEHDWAASTVNHHRSLLSLTFQLAIRNGKLSANPARATRHRKEDNSRARYLSAEEESRLREVMKTNWSGHIPELDLALHTGLRRSEMYCLDWEDVDLARRFLRVVRGKNGEGRYVSLNTIAIRTLTELQKVHATGPVIRNLSGERLCSPRYWFDKAIEAAGIEDFNWHDLRHTFASRLAMAGVGIRGIQEALGHKSISMTVRYAHLAPDFMADVVEKLVAESSATAPESTDTRTDTEAPASNASDSDTVH
jgi:site-specific recombinase XerD